MTALAKSPLLGPYQYDAEGNRTLVREPEGPETAFEYDELGTLTRNRVLVDGADEEAALEILAEPTPIQARALELASVSPLAE